jgi:phosphohistidine swiveling domain-containing protein
VWQSMTVAFGRTFTPPRPGAWETDLIHFPRAVTKFTTDAYVGEFARGFAKGSKMYGVLLDHLEQAIIHGVAYAAPRPVGAPLDAKGPPPKFIFKLLMLLHPEIRRRIRTSKDAIENRLWLKDLKHWDEVVKPRAIAENRAIQDVDPRALDAKGLEVHLMAATRNGARGIYRHGRFTMTACLPMGDFLVHASEWTGQPVHGLLRTVKGYSAVSSGVADQQLRDLAELLRADASAARMIDESSPAESLSALRNAEGQIGALARAWLDEVSYRMVTGYDVCDKVGFEMPEALLGTLKATTASPAAREKKEAIEADVTRLRDCVPEAHRPLFDQLLSDARAVYRLRDERDHYNDGWSGGLMRRALLEAGRRIADAGRIDSPELVVDANMDEIMALLRGAGGPSNDELRERAEWRCSVDPSKVPQRLGIPPSPPPPAEWLPPHAARVARAINMFLGALFQPGEHEGTSEVIRGIPVSAGVYEGPTRVVISPEDFQNVQKGDVLVARSTSPYFNVLLPLLGGIVTDRGGSLCHAAIVAREYGIPGVVGTKTATTLLKSGQRVRVDGGSGEVRIVGA